MIEKTPHVLVLGAHGQVGEALVRELKQRTRVTATTRNSSPAFDLSKPESLPALIEGLAPDIIINAAAYTAVDKAESEASLAETINAIAPKVIADNCAKNSIHLIHYSTDYVFDGNASTAYKEDNPVNPLGVYGATKLQGENHIIESGCNFTILRTSWVYSNTGNNFFLTMMRLAKERDELRIVDDQIGSPTWSGYLAQATAEIVDKICSSECPSRDLYHLTCSGSTSWYKFADSIFASAVKLGLLKKAPKLEPISSNEYPTPAKRPSFSVLDNSKIHRDIEIPVMSWEDALKSCLSESMHQI